MSKHEQPASDSDEPDDYRPRHAKPETPADGSPPENPDGTQRQTPAERAHPERPAISYSLWDTPEESADTATGDPKRSGRPDVAYHLPTEPEDGAKTRQPWSTAGFVLAVIALLFFPIIFGVIGIACGLYGRKRGEELGNWSAVAALTALLAGLAIRVFFFDADLIPAQN